MDTKEQDYKERINNIKEEIKNKEELLKLDNELTHLEIKTKDKNFTFPVYKVPYIIDKILRPRCYIIYHDKLGNIDVYGSRKKIYTLIKYNKELFINNGAIGTHRNKPAIEIFSGIPISVSKNDNNDDFCFDSETYYNILEHTITAKLTEIPNTFGDLFKSKTFWIFLIIIGIAIFLFVTPTGKSILANNLGIRI